MAYSFLVQNLKSFQYLFRDFGCVRLCRVVVHHISPQVSVLDVLHGKKDFVLAFEPAKELHKQVAMLQNKRSSVHREEE